MAVRRPGFAVFGMSFLDVIGSAFGAILLVFLVVSVMCSARAIERSYIMLQLKFVEAQAADPKREIAVPCRAVVLTPRNEQANPQNLEQLLAECEPYDLRQIARDAKS